MKYNVLIVDSNEKDCMDLKGYLENDSRFIVKKITDNANDALEYLENNSIHLVITDILLKNSDGFELLEKIKERNIEVKTLVLSALSGEAFVQKSLIFGAEYYMIKPYSYEVLSQRILDILKTKETSTVINVETKQHDILKNIDGKLSNIFITVGIPAHIKGYHFLREAIKMAIETPEIINSITKKLYPSIAEKFETSSSKVERAIRHAIEVAWNRGKIENINSLFGIKVYSDNEKPTNGEFIALVADKMLIEGA